MARNPYLLLLIVLPFCALGQKTDSLLNVLKSAQGEQKTKTLNELFRVTLPSDPVKALAYSHEALTLALETGDKKGQAASYNNLGVAYKNQGALDKSLEHYLTALHLYEGIENKEGIASLKNNIGNIYSQKKDYGKALQYLEQAHQAFVAQGNPYKIAGSLNNLGNLNLELNLYEKALNFFTEAKQTADKANLKFPDAVANMGNVYFNQGNYAEAIQFYQQSLALEKEMGDILRVLTSLTNLGIAHFHTGQYKAAEGYLDQAEIIVQSTGAYVYHPPILKYKSQILYRLGNLKGAYLKLVEYDSTREKINGEESARKFSQMEMALDLQEKEKEIVLLKKEDEIKSLQLHNSHLFIILTVLTIVIALGVANLYFTRKRKKKTEKK